MKSERLSGLSKKARLCFQEAARINGGKDVLCDDAIARAMAVLLAACVIGPSANRIARFLRLPRRQVRTWGRTARRSGIWRGGRVDADYFEKDGSLSLALDGAVLQGYLKRSKARGARVEKGGGG